MKQLKFDHPIFRASDSYGGTLRRRRRGRGARPLSGKHSLHLVLKVRDVTDGPRRSLRAPAGFAVFHRVLNREARKYGVRIQRKAVGRDHVHLLLRIGTRSLYKAFIRSLTGQVAKKIKALECARRVTDGPPPDGVTKGFWLHRPFTRIVRGPGPLRIVTAYIKLNEQEALGRIPYRQGRLRDLDERYGPLVWT